MAACHGDIDSETHLQRMQLEVVDGGEKIIGREIVDGELGPPFVAERVSASETEAVYFADLSEENGMDEFEVTLHFSSSTAGRRLEGCPDRGGDGWLVDPDE